MKFFAEIKRLLNTPTTPQLDPDSIFIDNKALKRYEKSLLKVINKFSLSSKISYTSRHKKSRETLEFYINGDIAKWLLPTDGMDSELIVENPRLRKYIVEKMNRVFSNQISRNIYNYHRTTENVELVNCKDPRLIYHPHNFLEVKYNYESIINSAQVKLKIASMARSSHCQ